MKLFFLALALAASPAWAKTPDEVAVRDKLAGVLLVAKIGEIWQGKGVAYDLLSAVACP